MPPILREIRYSAANSNAGEVIAPQRETDAYTFSKMMLGNKADTVSQASREDRKEMVAKYFKDKHGMVNPNCGPALRKSAAFINKPTLI